LEQKIAAKLFCQDAFITCGEWLSKPFPSRLRSAGFTLWQTLCIGGSAWRTPQGILVDVIETGAWYREVVGDSLATSCPFLILCHSGGKMREEIMPDAHARPRLER
jgi:hypothetical protein